MTIFFIFVTNLLNVYVEVPCSCINCFQTTKETESNEYERIKLAMISFHRFYMRQEQNLEISARSFQVGASSILTICNLTRLLIISVG